MTATASTSAPAFLEAGTPCWHAAWSRLRAHDGYLRGFLSMEDCNRWGDTVSLARQPGVPGGECWQYMGPTADGQGFRHRSHPVTGRREYVTISPTIS